MMEVLFASNKLARCYQDQRRATQAWGPEIGPLYIARVTTLMAAVKFADLFEIKSLYLHPLTGDRQGQYALTIQGRWRLIITLDDQQQVITLEEVSNHYGD